jgi:predicted nucleotidyltransferase
MNDHRLQPLRPQSEQLPHSISSDMTAIIRQFAQDAKTLLHENLVAGYLFGSYAKETYTSLSDIDILFLVQTFTPETRRALSGLASEYSLEYDVSISPIIKDQQVWEENKRHNTLFYKEVTQYGIPL